MHPKTISEPFKRRRNAFQEKINGLIFGIAIGDALGLPFRDIPHGETLQFEDTAIDYIDKVYFPDIGFRDEWPTVTSLALGTCRALIEIHGDDKPLKETLKSQFMRETFLKYTPRPVEQTNRIDGPAICGGRRSSLFMLLAPIAPFSCQYGLRIHQTIDVSVQVAKLYTDSLFQIFPAVELVLLLKSIFFGRERIPDVCASIKKWSAGKGLQKDFRAYLKIRNGNLKDLPAATDIWTWRTVEHSIMGLDPGERWADVQAFESAVLKVVNNAYRRDLAAAIAGAILGANWGYPKIPRRFSENIRGDVFLFDLTQEFVDTFFVFSLAKQYNEWKPRKTRKRMTPQTPDVIEEPALIFTAQEKINCMFFTVVVKNESLGAEYPGGVGAYAKKHGAICNDKISVFCDMGSETDVVIADLEKNSLKFDNDWGCFDAAAYAMELAALMGLEKIQESIPVDLNMDWLNAHFSPDDGFQVWYDQKHTKK